MSCRDNEDFCALRMNMVPVDTLWNIDGWIKAFIHSVNGRSRHGPDSFFYSNAARRCA